MSRVDVFRMIKRRVKTVGLGEANCNTSRATGITAYLLNGGTLKRASLHLIVDSTGLSIVGEGEWAAAKHGGQGRRGWRKLHLGVDGSRVIVACALTEPTADDAITGISLVDEVDGHLTRVTADPAYDTLAVYGAAGARGARVVVRADQNRVVVSTGRPIRCPRSDDQEGEGARTATVEEGVW